MDGRTNCSISVSIFPSKPFVSGFIVFDLIDGVLTGSGFSPCTVTNTKKPFYACCQSPDRLHAKRAAEPGLEETRIISGSTGTGSCKRERADAAGRQPTTDVVIL